MTTSWKNAVKIIAVIAILIGAVVTLVSGIIEISEDAILTEEGELAFSLAIWAIVWGSMALILLFFLAVDRWCSGGSKWAQYVGGFFMVFLAVPWLIVGQIFLMRRYTGSEAQEAFLYGSAIYALVLSYFMILALFGLASGLLGDLAETVTSMAQAMHANGFTKVKMSKDSLLRHFAS